MGLDLFPEERDVPNHTTLPFLVEKANPDLEKWGFDKGWWHSRRPESMFQVYHFPECDQPIDVVTSPKSCSSSIKQIWSMLVLNNHPGSLENPDAGVREKNYERHNVTAKNPWRENSLRIAIKRDPIERAFSAATYILSNRYKMTVILPDDYERFFFGVNHTLRYDPHLIQQYKLLGTDVNFYDHVYDVKEYNQFFEMMKEKYSFTLETNHKKKQMYSSTSIQDLSESCIERIKYLYRYDYQHGWF